MSRLVAALATVALLGCGSTGPDAGPADAAAPDALIACFVPECHTGCCDGPAGARYCCGRSRCDAVTFQCYCGDGPACPGPDGLCCIADLNPTHSAGAYCALRCL